MAKTQSTTDSNLPGFRIILRGTTRGGVPKRAVRTIHVKDDAAAFGYLAENGEKIAKSAGFKVDYCTVFPPVPK